MHLPKPKILHSNLALFPLESFEKTIPQAAARNWTGDYYEQATASLTGATRYRTDSRCRVCPDLRFRPNKRIFFESKGIGNTQHAIIYEHRWHKDQRWLRRHRAKFFYFFWSHRCSIKHIATISELQSALSQSIRRLYILSTDEIDPLIERIPKRILNTAVIQSGPNAGKRLGYGKRSSSNGPASHITGGIGWSIPLKAIQAVCGYTCYPFPFQVYNTTIAGLAVSTGKQSYQEFISWG